MKSSLLILFVLTFFPNAIPRSFSQVIGCETDALGNCIQRPLPPPLPKNGTKIADPGTYNPPGSVMSDIVVANGDFIVDPTSQIPECGDHRESRSGREAAALAQAFIVSKVPMLIGLAQHGGALVAGMVDQLEKQIGNTGGFLSQLLFDTGRSPRYASCGTVTLVIPPHTAVTNVFAMAAEEGATIASPCVEDDGQGKGYKLCSVGWSGWTWTQSGPVIVGTFKNWSHDRTRIARLQVAYATPE